MRLMKHKAVCAVTAAFTVCICLLTGLELISLRMEWNIPILAAINGGADSLVFQEYRQEEMALDESTENELLDELQGESTEMQTEERTDMAKLPQDHKNQENGAESGESENQENGVEQGENENPESDPPEFPYYIKVNRQANCITVYTLDENGEYTVPYKAMTCSTGLYNATPKGVYQISTKYRWRELYGGVYGQYATRIYGGVLFHSVPYYRKSENMLCTDKYNKLGQQASMGCVRLTVEDAKWIADYCPTGTTVEIYEAEEPGPLGKPEPIKIDTDNPNRGWDPTDPNAKNPWNELSEDN